MRPQYKWAAAFLADLGAREPRRAVEESLRDMTGGGTFAGSSDSYLTSVTRNDPGEAT
jgi:hypothetical protein